MDSLRYWVTEMHVDGFRFDLAATLARQFHEVDRLSAFFDLVQQDPVVSQVKLIAEPWDVGEGGYQVGQLPAAVDASGTASTATRSATSGAASPRRWPSSPPGSPAPADLYAAATAGARSPRSTSSPATTASRWPTWSPTTTSTTRPTARTTATAPTTTGPGTAAPKARPTTRHPRAARPPAAQLPGHAAAVPGRADAAAGDELGRTQRGNNNAYCQDNEISWVHWPLPRRVRAQRVRASGRARRRATPRSCSASPRG